MYVDIPIKFKISEPLFSLIEGLSWRKQVELVEISFQFKLPFAIVSVVSWNSIWFINAYYT